MAKMTAANFCKEHPWCCFCGGTTPSSNIDHQPARIIFPDKQRPKGQESPACHICNEQTRADEVLLAFICRFAGSKRPHATRDFHRLKKIFLGVRRGFPVLRAGNFSSDNSFFLKYHLENGGLYSLAVFHESVALLLILSIQAHQIRSTAGLLLWLRFLVSE
jgi:hypothetical protein